MEPVKTDGEIKEWFMVGFDEFDCTFVAACI